MHVLEVGKFYRPYTGGIETFLETLCQKLKKNNIDVEALVANTEARTLVEDVAGIRVTRLASLGRLFSTSLVPAFPWRMFTQHADIVHLQEPNPLAGLSYFLARPSGKMVITYHSDVVLQKKLVFFYRPILDFCLKRAVRIIVTSPKMLEYSDVLQPYAEKTETIPYGIDVAKYVSTPNVATESNQIWQQYGRNLLLFVGRLVYYKGVDVLIRAMADIPAKLLIIGSGPLEMQLKALVQELSLQEKVVFLGEKPEGSFAPYYHAARIFVLPSVAKSEAFGIVQLEAMACGTPVICTDLPSGVPWVNQHGITGLVVPPGDVKSLASAANQLLANPEICRRMGEAGRTRVTENFTEDLMAARYIKVFEACMTKK